MNSKCNTVWVQKHLRNRNKSYLQRLVLWGTETNRTCKILVECTLDTKHSFCYWKEKKTTPKDSFCSTHNAPTSFTALLNKKTASFTQTLFFKRKFGKKKSCLDKNRVSLRRKTVSVLPKATVSTLYSNQKLVFVPLGRPGSNKTLTATNVGKKTLLFAVVETPRQSERLWNPKLHLPWLSNASSTQKRGSYEHICW